MLPLKRESELIESIIKNATEFSSQDALDKYLKSHPKAKPQNHSVKQQQEKTHEQTQKPVEHDLEVGNGGVVSKNKTNLQDHELEYFNYSINDYASFEHPVLSELDDPRVKVIKRRDKLEVRFSLPTYQQLKKKKPQDAKKILDAYKDMVADHLKNTDKWRR